MTAAASSAVWRDALARWAIPADILDAAPASPWGFSVEVFGRAADAALQEDSPSTRSAARALPAGGTILDVGCGAGAASLPLIERIGRLIGVDESAEMLDALRERVETGAVDVVTVRGRWPDVADEVPVADVAVCRNVAYNVADLDAFVAQLTAHARRRVVLELTERHPLAWMNPYWRDLHGVERPEEPTAADAIAVVRETGVEGLEIERWERETDWSGCASTGESDEELARRLCVGPERLGDVRAARARHGVPTTRHVVAISWSGSVDEP